MRADTYATKQNLPFNQKSIAPSINPYNMLSCWSAVDYFYMKVVAFYVNVADHIARAIEVAIFDHYLS